MGCFSTAEEDEDDKIRREANKKIEKQLQKDKQLYRATHRLLLLGQYFGDFVRAVGDLCTRICSVSIEYSNDLVRFDRQFLSF